MTLIAATGHCDWCWGWRDPLPVIAGELAYCSDECRRWHAADPTKKAQAVEAYVGLGQPAVGRRKAAGR